MDMNKTYHLNISFNIDFAVIPEETEDDVYMIRQNVIDRVNARLSSQINGLEDLDQTHIQTYILHEALSECASSASVAQSEYEQNKYAEISDGIIVTATISQDNETLIEQIKEDVATEIATRL